ncbi:sodium-coupled neutral amino acid transporter 3-like [Cyprinus carpio]|uniref:Sodium-coupled neutral amino acid transporter 3-like n=1 Tax=Cyprinus carpio TaxID=7962 RepID=A0A9R0A513_CYPCA|nr:sodium-coupled neutral amino acid transporter 3-like [Cyprinus carpio]XP_042585714.1 sodium-coupled neutral amino acid transporter 3-like [Cyprinus carpio]XP_042585715.1 sodium-coupled neutral amino acid transporter 3-like [Cyprinus carpio]XP_042585716.1 sodium-coupled neutral amino acid transporter 3-like [Cyprinus carpio]XP_042585717.1 sodium-coupled neutral amino acid transporter 3-like [Cyprinus carpio]XP_042585718.1 sodium-coupled neutral amino acid transporter 3-like [Cyprinus carpio]
MELQKLSNGHHNLSPERIPENGLDALENMTEGDTFLPNRSNGRTETQFTDCNGKTSFGMSILNLSNAIIGSGILGLAYAMANTGIIFFVILLILIAVLSAYSIHLLLESAGVVGIRAYEQLGYHAFGQPGKILAACIIILHNIGAMSSYLFIVKIELPHIIQGLWPDISDYWLVDGKYLIIIVSVIFILPLALMKQIGYLGYTSGFSLSCMVFFLISVIYKKFVTECPDEHSYNKTVPSESIYNSTNDMCEAKLITANPQTAFTIPIMAFAFVCHPEVLPIYTELKNPSKKRMQNVANISILVMSVMYLLTAIFGYLTFYGNVESELLEMYSKKDILILCVRLAVLIAVTLTVPVVLFPIRRAILQLLFPDKPFHWVRHISIAVCLLFLVNLLVIFVAKIRDIFGFIGATSAPSLIFILPGIFYICIVPKDKEPLKSRPKIQAILFVTLGFILMIMSITFIIIEWVTGKKISGGH